MLCKSMFELNENFKYLDDLIHAGATEIVLDSNITLELEEESKYRGGIGIDVDDIVIDGNNHIIDANGRTRIFNITSKNVVIKNLVIKRGLSDRGAAMLINGSEVILKNVYIQDCISKKAGGALYNDGGKLEIMDSHLITNMAYRGGCIATDNGEVTISCSTFRSNIALKNGGAIKSRFSKIKIMETIFKDNRSRFGGAIHAFEGFLEIEKTSFDYNLVEDNGGAIFNVGPNVLSQGVLNITDSSFKGNFAREQGGAIYSRWGEANIFSSQLIGNISYMGGAISFYGGNLEIISSELSNNYAKGRGGALEGFFFVCIVSKSSFCYNYSKGGFHGGGAIYNAGFVSAIECLFSHNETDEMGGAIYNGGFGKDSVRLKDSRFYFNRAFADSAIHNSYHSTSEIEGCQFKGNEPEVDFDSINLWKEE